MSLTRRDWAKMAVAVTAAVPQASSQPAVNTPAANTPAANTKETLLNNARAQAQSSARDLAAVKLPRSTEPAARFEA